MIVAPNQLARCLVVAALVGCGGAPKAGPGSVEDSAHDPPRPSPTFVQGPCPWAPAEPEDAGVRCGTVKVPESRDKAGSGTLSIAVAVFAARAADPAPDPVVFLCGGPGSYCVGPGWAGSGLREARDLVVLDVRGVGASAPEPMCPELNERRIDALLADLSADGEVSRRAEDSLACIASLEDKGIDLGAYSSAAAAADIHDVIRALGYPEYNVWGLSYGGRIAQTLLRDRPEGVRAVVLDGPVPLDQERVALQTSWFVDSLTALFEACAAQPACARAFPSLEADFYDMVADYNERPLPLTVPATGDRPEQAGTLNGQDILAFMQRTMYQSAAYPLVPLYIQILRARQSELIAPVVARALSVYTRRSLGLRLLMNAYENGPFQTLAGYRADVARHSRLTSRLVMIDSDIVFYERWAGDGRPSAGPEELEPVRSQVPVLILVGGWDPITPPGNAAALLPYFPNGVSVTIPFAGHGMVGNSCGIAIGLAFLDDPSGRPRAAGCAAEASPPAFRVQP